MRSSSNQHGISVTAYSATASGRDLNPNRLVSRKSVDGGGKSGNVGVVQPISVGRTIANIKYGCSGVWTPTDENTIGINPS